MGMLTSIREVAKDARIAIGKAHLYMVSFSSDGFVTQTANYSYELGPLVMPLAKAQRLMAQTMRHFVFAATACVPVQLVSKERERPISVMPDTMLPELVENRCRERANARRRIVHRARHPVLADLVNQSLQLIAVYGSGDVRPQSPLVLVQ